MEVSSIVETITPAKAQEYLAASGGNRNISDRYVRSYANAMLQGKWALNGDAIVFDDKGKLVNGHHRLLAVIKAGVPIQSFVTRGVASQSFTTFDCGRHRTAGQLLGIQGVKVSNLAASIVKVAQQLLADGRVGEHLIDKRNILGSNAEIIALYDEYSELFNIAASYANGLRKKCNTLNASIVGGITFYLVEKGHYDFDFVKAFFDRVCSYESCSPNSLNLMRTRLLSEKDHPIRKTPRRIIMALLIKAWNSYATGVDIKTLRWSPEKEGYPTFILND